MHPTRTILTTSILAVFTPCFVHADVLDLFSFTGNFAPTLGVNVNGTNATAGGGTFALSGGGDTPAYTTGGQWLRDGTGGTASTSEAASITNNYYWTFTLNANSAYTLNLSNLTFNVARSGGSVRGYSIRTSLDNNFGTTVKTDDGTTLTQRNNYTAATLDLSGAQYQNISSITFRFYVFSAGTNQTLDWDDVKLSGTTVITPNGYLWTGGANNVWNTTDVNWTGTGNVSVPGGQYANATNVKFDDTGLNSNPISIPAAVTPNSIELKNSTANAYSFSGSSITASAVIAKTGNGLATFSNSVTTPTMSISAGTLAIAAGGSVSTPLLAVSSGATFSLDSNATLSSTASLTVSGNGILNVASQTLAGLNGDATGVLTLNGTALNVGGTSTYNGKITGSGSVTKNTAGTLTLAGQTSDFTGGLTVAGPGVLVLGGTVAGNSNPGGTQPITASSNAKLLLGTSAGVNVTSNIVLNQSSLGTTGGAAQNLNGNLSITGPVTLASYNIATGAGTQDLIINGLLSGTGDITATNLPGATNPDAGPGIRFRGPASTYNGTITVLNGTKFELATANSSALSSPIGTGTVVVTGGTINTTNTGTFSLFNLRNQNATLPANTNLGNNVRFAGTGLSLMNVIGGLPVANGATNIMTMGDLQIGDLQQMAIAANGTTPLATLQFGSVHLNGGSAIFTPGFSAAANTNYIIQHSLSLGTISELTPNSGFTMNGSSTLTLTGANTYTGPTNLQSGTTVLAAGSSIASSSAVTIATSAKLNAVALGTMNVPAAQTLTVNGLLDTIGTGSTAGTVNVSGTLRGGASTFFDNVIKANVTVASGGTVSPGVSGPSILSSLNLNMAAGSHFVADVAKATAGNAPVPGTDYDQYIVFDPLGQGQSIQLGSDLTVNVGSGVETNDIYTIINNLNGLNISGTFAGLPNGAIFSAGGRSFQISYFDFSGDTFFDLSGGNTVAIQAIPEPATAAFLLLGTFVPALRRRRRA